MKKLLNFAAISLFVIGWFTKCTTDTEIGKPNVIVMLADDLGYNDLSCYRNMHLTLSEKPPTANTPHIDQLAAEGMKFTDFYAGAPVCSPSRAALISGRNATRVGIYNWIPGNSPMHLRDEEVTIAEMLKMEGYQTAHFGKWHLTSQNMDQPLPNDQGFDYSFFAYNNAHPSHKNPDNYFRNGEPVGELNGYACHLVVDEAINWLSGREAAQKPFYINVWFNEPHTKLAAPDSLTQRHEYFSKYYGAIENMDYAVGKLMQFVNKKQLEENTIIIFTSDNGSQWPHSNDPLYGEKCFTFEGGVREPFIIKYPGVVPAGSNSDFVGSFTDVLPSIAAMTNTQLPQKKLDGIDLSSVFKAEAYDDRDRPVFFYRYFHDPICMLRYGDYVLLGYDSMIAKTVNLPEGELDKIEPWGFRENHMEYLKELEPSIFELYNIRTDEGQDNNIIGNHPELADSLRSTMLQLRDEMVAEGGDWFAENP